MLSICPWLRRASCFSFFCWFTTLLPNQRRCHWRLANENLGAEISSIFQVARLVTYSRFDEMVISFASCSLSMFYSTCFVDWAIETKTSFVRRLGFTSGCISHSWDAASGLWFYQADDWVEGRWLPALRVWQFDLPMCRGFVASRSSSFLPELLQRCTASN